MTDKEYEKLKKTLEEETQRRKNLVANEMALAEFQKEKAQLEQRGMQDLEVCLSLSSRYLSFRGNSYFNFKITDYDLVQSFLDNYEKSLILKIKQQRKALEKQ